MPISVTCPTCAHEFSIPEEYAGKLGKCPECLSSFRAPVAKIKAPAPRTRSAPPRKSAKPPSPSRLSDSGTAPLEPLAAAPVKSAPPRGRNGKSAPPKKATSAPKAGVAAAPRSSTSVDQSLGGPALVVDSEKGAGNRIQPRGKSNQTMVLLAIGGGIVAVLLVVAGVWALNSNAGPASDDDAQANNVEPGDSDDAPIVPPPASDADDDDQPASPAVGLSDAEIAAIWDNARPSIVELTFDSPDGEIRGLGFVVDQRGYIATSRHLIRVASAGRARFVGAPQDDVIPISGWLAQNELWDVVILKLAPELPRGFDALAPAESGDVRAGAAAVTARRDGDQILAQPVRIEKMAPAIALPQGPRAVLREREMEESPEFRLWETTATVTAETTGAPVLDRQGGVVGMAVRLNDGTGYAIDMAHVSAVAAEASGAATPFEPEKVAELDPEIDNAQPVDPEPDSDPQPQPATPKITASQIEALAKQCDDFDLRPETAAQYDTLAQLAAALFIAKRDEEKEGGAFAAASEAAEKVLQDWRGRVWRPDTDFAGISKLAADNFSNRGKGVFAYGRILGNGDLEGAPIAIMQLIGTNKSIVVPTTKNAGSLTRDSRWLIIGKHDAGSRILLEINNTGRQMTPLVKATHLIGEPN